MALCKKKPASQVALQDAKDKMETLKNRAVQVADESKVKVSKMSKKAAKKAAAEAAKVQKKLEETAGGKQHKSRKGLITLLLVGAAGATAYFLWKRSQPVEDPWAEAYWEDIANSDTADVQTPDSSANDTEDESEKSSSEQADANK